MSEGIGMAGRRAREHARQRRAQVPRPAQPPPPQGSLPLVVQRAVSQQSGASEGGTAPSAPAGQAPAEATERVPTTPSPEEIADRVYRLFCQELRLDRERTGR